MNTREFPLNIWSAQIYQVSLKDFYPCCDRSIKIIILALLFEKASENSKISSWTKLTNVLKKGFLLPFNQRFGIPGF